MSETEPQFKGPAIAVVVPVHNGAAFLQQCLASLAAQTFGDFACFVVDDGSTDESAELAAANDNDVHRNPPPNPVRTLR